MAAAPTDAEHLASILADPDDDAPRAVFADALQERDDPRGEFIALQLARAAGRATREGYARERALVAQHGGAWAGTLARWFRDPVFERGFFAGGALVHAADYAPLLADTAWPLVTTLVGVYDRERRDLLLDDPRSRIGRIELSEGEAHELLADRRPRPLRELTVRLFSYHQDDPHNPLRTCATLPDLETLGVTADWGTRIATLFADAPVMERLSRLVITGLDDKTRGGVGKLVAALAHRAGRLRTIELRLTHRRMRDLGWVVWLERDTAPGPFSGVRAWWLDSARRAPKDLATDCETILAVLPLAHMREVEIDLGRPMRMPPATVRRAVELLEGMPRLEHAWVPFPFEPPAGAATRWEGEMMGAGLAAAMPEIWSCFTTDLGAPFDSYTINQRGTPKLGRAPAATLARHAAAATTESLAVRRTGAADHVTLRRWGSTESLRWSIASSRSPAAIAAWFLRSLALPTDHASLQLASTTYGWNAFPLEGYGAADPGWLVALSPDIARMLARDGVAPLLARVPYVRILDRASHLVLQLGDAPGDATEDRAREVAAAVVVALDLAAIPQAPAWFAPLATDHVAPHAARAGYEPSAASPVRLVWARGSTRLLARLVATATGWILLVDIAGHDNQTFAHETDVDEASAEAALVVAQRDLSGVR